MTLTNYNTLPQEQKYFFLLENGVQIDLLQLKEFVLILFQINGFYVEVKYSLNKNMVVGEKAFTDMALLDPYLEQIDIFEISQILDLKPND
jgi:hypothetical protein